MRGLLVRCVSLAVLAAVVCVLSASPVPPESQTASSAKLREEAQNYGNLVYSIIARIEADYLRPVSRAELVEAALDGLYGAARQPLPASLASDLQRLDEGDLMGLLVRTREQLGSLDALQGNRAVIASLQTLPRVLDPHSGLIGPQDYGYLDLPEGVPAIGLEFVGGTLPALRSLPPGLAIIQGDFPSNDRPAGPSGPLRIQTVVCGGPAQRAGIRPGDLIVKLDGQSPETPAFANLLRRLQLSRVQPIANLPPSVRFTLLRPGRAEPIDIALAPAAFRPESVFGARRQSDGSWDFLIDPTSHIGYIRIGAISRYNTLSAFYEALKSLRGQSVRGLVLDLRWSPVGYLDPSATIARSFLPEGAPVAIQRHKNGRVEPVTGQLNEMPHLDYPVVVLVSGATSGGGELIAAALQDNGRAVIAGQRTAGKGTIQTALSELEAYNINFKLTTGSFIRPSGKNLQRNLDSKLTDDWGVRPDAGRDLPLTAESSRQLKEWWTLYELRPANSTEALPLDDPDNDPQRQAAIQMVRELIKKQP